MGPELPSEEWEKSTTQGPRIAFAMSNMSRTNDPSDEDHLVCRSAPQLCIPAQISERPVCVGLCPSLGKRYVVTT